MSKFKNLMDHLRLVHTHRKYVRQMCFKMGIPIQGLLHDLSKYSLKELSICKYYNGKQSPHEVARKEIGYSPSWMAHKAKNKHHWEYWTDNDSDANFYAVKMPYKYVIESFCDMVGASKAYLKENFKKTSPKEYFDRQKDKRLYHPQTKELLEELFEAYAFGGEKTFLYLYKTRCKGMKKRYETTLIGDKNNE